MNSWGQFRRARKALGAVSIDNWKAQARDAVATSYEVTTKEKAAEAVKAFDALLAQSAEECAEAEKLWERFVNARDVEIPSPSCTIP